MHPAPAQRRSRRRPAARGVWLTQADILAIGQMLPELMTPRQAKRAAAADAQPPAPDAPEPLTADVLDRWASIGLR